MNPKMEKIILNTVKVGILLIMVTPFMLSEKFMFPYIFTKTIAFRMALEVIFFLWLILLTFDFEKYKPKLSLVGYLFIGYLASLTISSILGPDFYSSFWGDIERSEGLLTILHYGLLFLIFTGIFKTKKDWLWMLNAAIIGSLPVALFAFGQYLKLPFLLHACEAAEGCRVDGTIGNPSFLAGYMLFIVAFSVLLFLEEIIAERPLQEIAITNGSSILTALKTVASSVVNRLKTIGASRGNIVGKWKKYCYLIAFLFFSFILFETGTRGAMVAFVGGAAAFLLLNIIFAKNKQIKRWSLGVVIVFAGIIVFLLASKNQPWLANYSNLNRFTKLSFTDITTESRLLTWESALQGWQERPLFGWGVENFNLVFNKYFKTKIYRDAGSQIWFDRAHNIVFDVGVSGGTVGFILYLSLFITSIFLLWKKYLREKSIDFYAVSAVSIILIVYFLQNLFVFDTLSTYLMWMITLGFINFLLIKPQEEISSQQETYSVFTYVSIGLLALIPIYIFNVKPVLANYYAVQGLRLSGGENGQQQLMTNIKKALAYDTYQNPEIRLRLSDSAIGLLRAKKRDKGTQEIVEFAIKEMKANIAEHPEDVSYKLFLITLYNYAYVFNTDYLNQIYTVGEEALKQSPTRPQIYYEMGQAAISQFKYNEGVEYFKKGVDLNPLVMESHWNLAAAYILADRIEDAKNTFKFMEDNMSNFKYKSTENLNRVLPLYISKQLWPAALEVYQFLTELNGENAEYYTKIATIYAKMKDKDNAIKYAQKVVELQPAAKAQVDEFIANIKKGIFE